MTENNNVLAIKLCKKHGKPLRKNQRNCHECNRIANKKYKTQLKADAAKYREARKLFVAAS